MKEPRPRPDADPNKPAAWRWILFVTLCLVVASFWLPTVRIDETDDATPFTATNVLLLIACVGLAVTVVPATSRIRMIIALVMLTTTCAAWLLSDPIRNLLGPSWSG